MTIEFYQNLSDNNVVSKKISRIALFDGYLKNACSIQSPVILIDLVSNSINQVATSDNNEVITSDNNEVAILSNVYDKLLSSNYCYISEFKRYYYINDIIVVSNKLIEIHLNRDVLMSFSDNIYNLDAFVLRNEFIANYRIEDNLPFEYKYKITENDITGGSFEFKGNPKRSDVVVAVTYLSTNDDSISITYALDYYIDAPETNLPKIGNATGNNVITRTIFLTFDDYLYLLAILTSDTSRASYIISVIVLPFEIENYSKIISPLYIGNTLPLPINYYIPKDYMTTLDGNVLLFSNNCCLPKYRKLGSFKISDTNTFLHREPYSKYELYLPYYGYVELNSNDIIGYTINIYYVIDYSNGHCNIIIYNHDLDYVISSYECEVGIKIPLNVTNAQQINDSINQLNIKTAISSISSVATMIGGAITYNPIVMAGGAMSLGGALSNYGGSIQAMHTTASTSISSGNSGLFNNLKPRLKVTRYVRYIPDNYAKLYGLPTNATFKLSNLEGYTVCDNFHLDDFTNATKSEIDEISSLLKQGIILKYK